jgi:hypothetical protein
MSSINFYIVNEKELKEFEMIKNLNAWGRPNPRGRLHYF